MHTLIENGTVVAWNGSRHHGLEPGVVAFKDNAIVHVGETSDPDAQYAAAECALAEFARSGSTPIVALGYQTGAPRVGRLQ